MRSEVRIPPKSIALGEALIDQIHGFWGVHGPGENKFLIIQRKEKERKAFNWMSMTFKSIHFL